MLFLTRPIKTKDEYKEATDRIEKLLHAAPDTPEGDELEMLILLVEDYDRKHAYFPPLDPIAAIKVRMEDLGLKQKDLISAVGHEGAVSDVLRGKRPWTLKMVRNLSEMLSLPVETLVGYEPRKAS